MSWKGFELEKQGANVLIDGEPANSNPFSDLLVRRRHAKDKALTISIQMVRFDRRDDAT